MPYLYYFVCVILLYSCGGNSSRQKDSGNTEIAISTLPKEEVKYVNSIKITSPEKNKLYSFGEEITVHFENKDRFPIDSVVISLNGYEIVKSGKDTNHFRFRIPEGKTGNTVIKVTTWHPDQKRGSASVNIRLKPAEAPVKYCSRSQSLYPRIVVSGWIYVRRHRTIRRIFHS